MVNAIVCFRQKAQTQCGDQQSPVHAYTQEDDVLIDAMPALVVPLCFKLCDWSIPALASDKDFVKVCDSATPSIGVQTDLLGETSCLFWVSLFTLFGHIFVKMSVDFKL